MTIGLVLSGGGPLAVAWECGVAGGLATRGIALGSADLILGTSAGAIVGLQLAAGRDPEAMAQAILDEKSGKPPPGAMTTYHQDAVAKLPDAFAKALSGKAGRVEVGEYALRAATSESEADYVARMELSLGLKAWPDRNVGVVAVDATTGEHAIFAANSGATLGQTVAASCCLPGLSPPVTIGERRYIDGGMRSSANVDLLGPCERVLVLNFRPPGPAGDRMQARALAQVEQLEASGAHVQLVLPNDTSLMAIGPRTMDVTRRPDVVHAGMVQGAALAASLREFGELATR